MTAIDYRKLRIIVADDFSNFRATVTAMLYALGVNEVESVASGKELLQWCRKKTFDVVLCDYDLGPGKNGQQVLEDIRQQKLLPRNSLFVLVTADTSRNVVMSAYDCEPDDYLIKPITAKSLEQRLARLLRQRQEMMPIYRALDGEDYKLAMTLLASKASGNTRSSVQSQKLLGELYLQQGEYDRAENLYRKVLQGRPLDWANLGLIRVLQARGQTDAAIERLNALVAESPLFLPAYDALADAWRESGDRQKLQRTLETAVEISPMSIVRQQELGEVAEGNQDLPRALKAFRRSLKLGQYSCHARPLDSFGLARTFAAAKEQGLEQDSGLAAEVLSALATARERFSLSAAEAARANLLQGRVCASIGRSADAREALAPVMDSDATELDLDSAVDLVASLRSLGETARAEAALKGLLKKHRGDQNALEKLDFLLEEPASDSNKRFVARINQEGIELYDQKRYLEAVERFAQASRLFPKNIGIQLNIAQALLGQIKQTPDDTRAAEFRQTMDLIGGLIERDHPQYDRYNRLRAMAGEARPAKSGG